MGIGKRDKYNLYFEKWKDKLYSYLKEAQSEGKKVILVAMSRKMPRLFEWMKINMGLDLTDCIFLTEHSIPFYFPAIKNINDYKVYVFDDAIYYGSTLENVASNINWLTNEKIQIDAIVKKENIKRRFIYSIEPEDGREIETSFIPFYTSANSERIISLRKPLDMEYPIFTIEKEGIGTLLETKDVEACLKACFPEAFVYRITHVDFTVKGEERLIHNYTVLFKTRSNGGHYNNDFCKLRFYVGDNHFHVVSYAPNVIDDLCLVPDSILFNQTQFKEVWNKVAEAAVICPHERTEQGDVLSFDIQKNEYELRRKRSLTVWANYLSSFSSLLSQKKQILTFLNKIGIADNFIVKKDDLQLLLGPLLADEICKLLMDIYMSEVGDLFNICDSQRKVTITRSIPEGYVVDYDKRNNSFWFRCKSLPLALSYMFTNQHFHIGLASMTREPDNFEKLRFGVSYESMYSELSSYFKDENLSENIHRWIDKRIDEGIVVPKYERIKIDDNYYWKRLFRAGENEDNLVKIARICLYVMSCIEERENSFTIDEGDFENILSIIWNSSVLKNCLNLNYLKDSEFKIQACTSSRSFYFRSLFVDEENIQLTELLTQLSYILYKSDGAGCNFIINYNNTTSTLLESTSLDTEQEEMIATCVSLYLKYVKFFGNETLVNNFFQESATKYKEKKRNWLDELLKWIDINQKQIVLNYLSEQKKIEFERKYIELMNIFFETYLATDLNCTENLSDREKELLNKIQVDNIADYNQYLDMVLDMQLYTQLLDNMLINENKEKSRTNVNEICDYKLIKEDSDTYHLLNTYLNNWDVDTKKEESRRNILACIRDLYTLIIK